MKIGIDIDDTITDSWECLIPYYSRLFNISEIDLLKSKPYYSAIQDKLTLEEYFEVMTPIYDEVIPNVNLLPSVKETIDRLYDMGCQVYFITARGRGHSDAYKDSKDFLDKYHIKYEKIITGMESKTSPCMDEKIDLFIDDSFRHCTEVSKLGIDVLMHETKYNKEYTEFNHFNDWNYVYDYVRGRIYEWWTHLIKWTLGRR